MSLFSASVEQTVTIEVGTFSSIVINGPPVSLNITDEAVLSVSDTSNTYDVSTTKSDQIIMGEIDENMPAGTTLSIELAAPGACSLGNKTLSTTATQLVTDIDTYLIADQITFTFSAISTVLQVAGSRIVTLTLMDG